jgi:hypothetical protein
MHQRQKTHLDLTILQGQHAFRSIRTKAACSNEVEEKLTAHECIATRPRRGVAVGFHNPATFIGVIFTHDVLYVTVYVCICEYVFVFVCVCV